MCAYLYHRGDATRNFGRCSCEDMRVKIGYLHTGYRSELCVSFCFVRYMSLTKVSVKYIALLAMAKIIPTHPHLITQYQDIILSSINDPDISIRIRALDLLSAMVRTTVILGLFVFTLHIFNCRPIEIIHNPLYSNFSTPRQGYPIGDTNSNSVVDAKCFCRLHRMSPSHILPANLQHIVLRYHSGY